MVTRCQRARALILLAAVGLLVSERPRSHLLAAFSFLEAKASRKEKAARSEE